MHGGSQSSRVFTIDIARFYAITLVFFGHIAEEFMVLKNPAGAYLYKFTYSFHMLIFPLLAGYVAKEEVASWRITQFIKHCFATRLVPFIFLTLVMMIPPLFFDGKFYGLPLPELAGYLRGLTLTVFGLPSFCIPSWFLLMVIGLEIVHYISFRFLKDSNTKILVAAVVFYVAGYWLNLKFDIFNPLKGRTIGWNYFFIHGAITLYGFYLLGIFLRRRQVFTQKISTKLLTPAAVAAFLIVLFTFQLNNGPFNFHVYNYVVLMFASYGHFLLFPLTALAGCALVLFLAGMTPSQKTIVWMGQNTLLLMFLNGIFYHYINPPLAEWILNDVSTSGFFIFSFCCIFTVVSLALCTPFVELFNRLVPQLVGKTKQTGLLLKKPLHFKWLPQTAYITFLFLPLLPLVSVSFHSTLRGSTVPVGDLTFANYINIFKDPVMTSAIINSITYVTLNILITIPVALMAAYAFSRYSFKGDKPLFFWFLTLRMTPPVVMVLPVFLIFLQIDLVNRPLGIALAHCAFNVPISIWVLESFLSAIPREIDETAFIDGYSFFQFFTRILIPMMAPGIAVTAFFCFMFSWVEIVFARILTVTAGKPISMAISTLFTFRTDLGMVMAMTVLSILPGVFMVYFVRNHIAKGFIIK